MPTTIVKGAVITDDSPLEVLLVATLPSGQSLSGADIDPGQPLDVKVT